MPNFDISLPFASIHALQIGRLASAGTFVAMLVGCVDESVESGEYEDALAAETSFEGELDTPSIPDSGADTLSMAPGDGTRTGQATIPTIFGETEVTYRIVGDRAILEGDIDLGPVDEHGDLIQFRNGVVDDNFTWQGGDIPFQIDPNLTNSSRVTNAIATLEARTSIRFRARTVNDTDYIYFTTSTETDVSRSPLGRQGGKQNITIWPTHGSNIIVHEIMHSLGFFHEHTRGNRDNHVEVHLECVVNGAEPDFAKRTDSVDLEPYDLNSIMHYGPDNFCVRDAMKNCVCDTMTLTDGVTPVPFWSGTLTTNDINTLYRVYHNPVGANEAGDRFGAALAHGDFDNDGYEDLAVGIPFEEWGTTMAGAVALYKGNAAGKLVPWKMLAQFGTNEEGDQFGASLAVGDFNDDGFADLAVGAPGEAIGSVSEAGAVYVFRGSATGLQSWSTFHQATSPALGINETGDRFGEALAVGRLSADSYYDLVVGSPEWNQGSGSVFVYAGTATSLLFYGQLRQSDAGGSNENGDLFGLSLAVGKFSSDSADDLAVGAPGEDVGSTVDAGQVYMFKTVSGFLTGWHNFGQAGLGADEAYDYFGNSLAAGEVWNTGSGNKDDLVVGAPGEDIESESASNAGAVFVFSGGGTNMVARVGLTEDDAFMLPYSSNGFTPESEPYDDFGRALTIGDFDGDGDGDLVVGIPQQDDQVGAAVHFFNGDSDNFFWWSTPIQQSLVQYY